MRILAIGILLMGINSYSNEITKEDLINDTSVSTQEPELKAKIDTTQPTLSAPNTLPGESPKVDIKSEPQVIAPTMNTPDLLRDTLIDSSRVRFSAILFYSTANKASFGSVYGEVGGKFFSGNLDFNTDMALGFGVEINKLKNFGWGFGAGLTFDQARNINSVSGPGGTSVYTDKPEFSILTGYYNAIYLWERFYIPFGFNISKIDMKKSSDVNTQEKAGFGLQAGAGYVVNETVHVDLMLRMISSSLKDSGGSDYIDYGPGYLTGLQLNFKIFF